MPIATEKRISADMVRAWLESESMGNEEFSELLAELANGEYDQYDLYEDIIHAQD